MGLTRDYLFDSELQLLDSQTITADDVAQVGGSDKILDLGGDDAFASGDLVIVATALKITANDETYDFVLQGSSSSTFASDVNTLARYRLGPKEVLGVASIGVVDKDHVVGTHVLPFYNWVANEDGRKSFRYLRLVIDVAGTSPSFTGEAFISVGKPQ